MSLMSRATLDTFFLFFSCTPLHLGFFSPPLPFSSGFCVPAGSRQSPDKGPGATYSFGRFWTRSFGKGLFSQSFSVCFHFPANLAAPQIFNSLFLLWMALPMLRKPPMLCFVTKLDPFHSQIETSIHILCYNRSFSPPPFVPFTASSIGPACSWHPVSQLTNLNQVFVPTGLTTP